MADAKLPLGEIGGLVTFSVDPNDPVATATALGLSELSYFAMTPYGGGGGCATVQEAAIAVERGIADVVVAYRAANLRSGTRYGRPNAMTTTPADNLYLPYGLVTPAQRAGLLTMRYLADFGLSNRDIAPVAVSQRNYAASNPAARFHGRPITIEEHQDSPWIVEPALRLLDCCLESDGGVALVVTTAERARDLGRDAVEIVAAARGMIGGTGGILKNFYRPTVYDLPETRIVARQLYAQSGLGPQDIDVAEFYDHFSPFVLLQLEAFGFCDTGKAAGFVADGQTAIDGALPVNTHGGHLSEAYIHGMNAIAEAVRQLRGQAVNQVAFPEHALVSSGPGLATSGLILRAPA
jgi:acetyl-CoA acetyltransferase